MFKKQKFMNKFILDCQKTTYKYKNRYMTIFTSFILTKIIDKAIEML